MLRTMLKVEVVDSAVLLSVDWPAEFYPCDILCGI